MASDGLSGGGDGLVGCVWLLCGPEAADGVASISIGSIIVVLMPTCRRTLRLINYHAEVRTKLVVALLSVVASRTRLSDRSL